MTGIDFATVRKAAFAVVLLGCRKDRVMNLDLGKDTVSDTALVCDLAIYFANATTLSCDARINSSFDNSVSKSTASSCVPTRLTNYFVYLTAPIRAYSSITTLQNVRT